MTTVLADLFVQIKPLNSETTIPTAFDTLRSRLEPRTQFCTVQYVYVCLVRFWFKYFRAGFTSVRAFFWSPSGSGCDTWSIRSQSRSPCSNCGSICCRVLYVVCSPNGTFRLIWQSYLRQSSLWYSCSPSSLCLTRSVFYYIRCSLKIRILKIVDRSNQSPSIPNFL